LIVRFIVNVKSGKQRKKEMKEARAKRDRKKDILKSGEILKEAADGQAPCNPNNLAPYNSYGEPVFVQRGFYQDIMFQCIGCGVKEVWKSTQQKWWYEIAKGHVDTTAIRCRSCRKKERERKDEARRVHQKGIARENGKYT
jgi:hypothetical protein